VVTGLIDTYRRSTLSQRQVVLAEVTNRPAAVLCASAERLAALAVRTRSVGPLHQALIAVGMAVEALDDYAYATTLSSHRRGAAPVSRTRPEPQWNRRRQAHRPRRSGPA
jgi:hypothetical protein